MKQLVDRPAQYMVNNSHTAKNNGNLVDAMKQGVTPYNQIDMLLSTYGASTYGGLSNLTLKSKSRVHNLVHKSGSGGDYHHVKGK